MAACTVDGIELEGRECPCIGGFLCDTATNTCVAIEMDAGPADAAAVDAPIVRADAPEPTMTDGATADAGAPDTGPPDAGLPDAGLLDGGPVTITLGVVVDTYVDDSMTTTSFSDAPAFLVDGSPFLGALVQFEDPGLGAGTEIVSAIIELTCFDAGSEVVVNALTESWDASVTWDTRPTRDSTTLTTFTPEVGPITIDITSLVQEWVDGDRANYGVLFLTSGTNGSDYHSSEHAIASERPRLVVVHR